MNGLLSFEPDTRRVWMFPRNIRDIAPWKLYKILKVLLQCDSLDQYSGEDQKMMYRLLEESGIKKPGSIRDRNPGGMRTYYSQLETLGLVFRVEDKNTYNYTIAGEAIVNEENPIKVLQYQLLRHQYPSAYALGRNVRIDPRMKVKPFLFILKLMHDEELDHYLTSSDVVFPVIYGHSNSCYEYVRSKILEYRETGSFVDVIDDWDNSLYTPRGSADKALNNILDIANTALNYLKASSLVIADYHKIDGRTRYLFNENYEQLYHDFMKECDSFLPIKTMDEYQSFQRSYGRYLKSKDTRSSSDEIQQKVSPTLQFATIKYIEYLNSNLFDNQNGFFVAEMAKYGIPFSDANRAVELLDSKKRTIEERTYLDYAFSGGTLSEEFEKATTSLFISLGFNRSKWIGRKKSFANWRGNFPDVFIQKEGTNDCGMADAKATSSYSLGHADMLKLKDTYISSNKELDCNSRLVYFLYIAGGFKGNTDLALEQLGTATNIPVTALDAKGMLKLKSLVSKGWSANDIEEKIFFSGRYVSSDEIEIMN